MGTYDKQTEVLVLADTLSFSVQVLYCLRLIRARVHVIGRPATRLLKWSRYCSSFREFEFHTDATNQSEFDSMLADFLDEHPIDVIVPVGQLSQEVLARARGSLLAKCFPIPSIENSLLYNDKWSFFELCVRSGVPVPRSARAESKDEIACDRFERDIGFPLVVKPTLLGNGTGVIIVNSRRELEANILLNARYDFRPLIVQEFIAGQEIDLSLLARDGAVIAHTVQRRNGKTVRFERNENYLRSAERVVAARKFTGLAHIDAIREASSGEIKFLECNARTWGSVFASACAGMNFYKAGIASMREHQSVSANVADGTFLPAPFSLLHLLGMQKTNAPLSPASWIGLRYALGDPATLWGEYLVKMLTN